MEPNKTADLMVELAGRGLTIQQAAIGALTIRMDEVDEKVDRILSLLERKTILEKRGISVPGDIP